MPTLPRSRTGPAADGAPAMPSAYGIAAVVAGVVLVLAGPVVLGMGILPQLIPTFGPELLTVMPRRASTLAEDGDTAAVYFGALLLPAGGFSLAYLSARHRLRSWIAGACVVLFGVQTVLLAAALLWITGSGLPASAIVDTVRADSTGLITAPLALFASLAAAAIMHVLARRTDFDAKSSEYFEQGDTVVRVRPLSLWLHALAVLAVLAVWGSVVWLPALAVHRIETLGLDGGARGPEPWPVSVSGDFATARAGYAVFLGILAGGVASSLFKKALYRSSLGSSMQRPVDDRTADRWRAMHTVTHWPIALAGGTLTACVLFLVRSERFRLASHEPDTTAIAIFAAISLALVVLGGYFVASAWKSGDDPLYDSPLQQASWEDAPASFGTTARRRRRKRPRRSKKRR